jgi:hypothetical protein
VSTEEPEGTEAEPQERPYSVQDMQADLVRHVYTLAKKDVFTGHPAYQAVLIYYMFNTARYDSEPRGFRHGFVMPGCTYPAAVAKATSLTPRTIHRANTWLHQQRLIEITNAGTSIEPLPGAISWENVEEERQKRLDEDGPAPSPELRSGPRPKRRSATTPARDESGHEVRIPEADGDEPADILSGSADESGPDVRIVETSGPNRKPGIRTSCPTYSSRSSTYIPDGDKQERAERASVGCHHQNEREEGKRASAAPPSPADSRPARAQRASYDNTFRYGKARDGVPYFTRGRNKPRKSDEGTVTLTTDEAVKYFQLLKDDKDGAWIDYKHELYEKYAA